MIRRMRRAYNMPVIGMVGSVKVLMYYNDHAPPHVHLDAGGDVQVVVEIVGADLPSGLFSKPDRKAILKWIRDHETELLANWARASAGIPLVKIT